MKRRGEWFRFLGSVLASVVLGFVGTDLLHRAFWGWENSFRWPSTVAILIVVGAMGGYWLYARHAAIADRKGRLRVSLICHLAACVLSGLTLLVYALWYPPRDGRWGIVYALWGLVVAGHGVWVWRAKDAPEDIFV